MKRLLTMLLVTALVLSLAGTAAAFTGIHDEQADLSDDFSVNIELVNYNYGFNNGIYTYSPSANRSYAINEMIGAIVTVKIPANSSASVYLKISSDGIRLFDVDADTSAYEVDSLSNYSATTPTLPKNAKSDKTLRWFITGQLININGGSITAKVVDSADDDEIASNKGITVYGRGADYNVRLSNYVYYITGSSDCEYAEDIIMEIAVKKDYYCKSMTLDLNGEVPANINYGSTSNSTALKEARDNALAAKNAADAAVAAFTGVKTEPTEPTAVAECSEPNPRDYRHGTHDSRYQAALAAYQAYQAYLEDLEDYEDDLESYNDYLELVEAAADASTAYDEALAAYNDGAAQGSSYFEDYETFTLATVNGRIAFKDSSGRYLTYNSSGWMGSAYDALTDIYNEFCDDLKLSYTKEGYLYKSFFTGINGSVTVSDTVYVDSILSSTSPILNPGTPVTLPQTGSVSLLGFGLMAAAAAAAVAVKKLKK